jgi:hypothetical protein
MKIKNYHIFSKDPLNAGYVKVSGILILKNKRVVCPISPLNLKKFPNNAVPQRFKFERGADRFLANPSDRNGEQIDIQKKIFIKEINNQGSDSKYDLHEEYIIDKTWLNTQQLLWMFGEHWLQKEFRFVLPYILSVCAFAFSIFAFLYSSKTNRNNARVEDRMDSVESIIRNEKLKNKTMYNTNKLAPRRDTLIRTQPKTK